MQLGVREVVAVVQAFSARLETNRSVLDALNVFPVADNDTGSNMVRTLEAITAALADVDSLDVAARLVETAALDGRGNSGLIIGQYLGGFFSSFDGDTIELASGLGEGARWARRAVATPVEGTILTVADVAAAAAEIEPRPSPEALVETVSAAVEATQNQLAVLTQRGVVDSGAAGLLLFFEALASVTAGRPAPDVPAHGGPTGDVIACDVGLDSVGGSADQVHGYEIQFRIPAFLMSAKDVRTLLVGLGTDVVVASSDLEHAAHLHVADPHLAIAAISAVVETQPGAKAISYDVQPLVESGHPT